MSRDAASIRAIDSAWACWHCARKCIIVILLWSQSNRNQVFRCTCGRNFGVRFSPERIGYRAGSFMPGRPFAKAELNEQ